MPKGHHNFFLNNLKSRRQKLFDQSRQMEEQAQHQISLADELARKDRQLELLRQAYTELQQINAQHQQQAQYAAPIQNDSYRENILKTVNHLPTFTGTGEVTINSFFSSIEYLLSTIADENIRKEAVRTIFYKTIQGQAKEVIINIPTPDNWELIKETLKLRYRPSVEPHQLYKMIANLKVNNVSELIVEIQNIKYKADELIIYYKDDHYINLSNIDSLLVNTIKEMTQGTLFDKIYEERNINDILKILTKRRFEDSCIRHEYRKFKTNKFNNTNTNMNYNRNLNRMQGNFMPSYNNYNNNTNKYRSGYNNNYQFFDSGRFKNQNNFNRFSNSGNFHRPQPQNHKQDSGQYRQNQYRQGPVEPMEIDNINLNVNRPQRAGHPNPQIGQNRLISDRQSQEEILATNNMREEINNCVFFMKEPRNGYPR